MSTFKSIPESCRRASRTLSTWSSAVVLSLCCNLAVFSQDQTVSKTPTTTNDEASIEKLVLQNIQQLSDTSYRVRQIAKSNLELYPNLTLKAIPNEIHHVSAVAGIQLVDLVSAMAMYSDLAISTQATDLLQDLANDVTSVGRAASNSLSAIADLQEAKAVEILTHNNAYIGPQNFSVNGRLENAPGRLSLMIDDHFSGTDEDLQWIRFLKSVEVLYLRGYKISSAALEAACQLKQLKVVKLRSVKITAQQLAHFQSVDSLEHLGLSYMPVDDSFIASISQLPITESIRLYGTKISPLGQKHLTDLFEGIEVFRGAGGFLGISSTLNSTEVDRVTYNSAAYLAGIRTRDRILSINGVAVKTFDQLREELGKFEADEKVQIVVERYVGRFSPDEPDKLQITVSVTLQEEI